jgi:hypothetical protein
MREISPTINRSILHVFMFITKESMYTVKSCDVRLAGKVSIYCIPETPQNQFYRFLHSIISTMKMRDISRSRLVFFGEKSLLPIS